MTIKELHHCRPQVSFFRLQVKTVWSSLNHKYPGPNTGSHRTSVRTGS